MAQLRCGATYRGVGVPSMHGSSVIVCRLYSTQSHAFVSTLFGLAHLNHYWETVYPEKHDHGVAALITGFRFAYTTIFGWYAAFLYLRTGHLLAPLVAHIFCNVMGLPAIYDAANSPNSKVIGCAFLIGLGGFTSLLFPVTSPALYYSTVSRSTCGGCWLGYCQWTP